MKFFPEGGELLLPFFASGAPLQTRWLASRARGRESELLGTPVLCELNLVSFNKVQITFWRGRGAAGGGTRVHGSVYKSVPEGRRRRRKFCEVSKCQKKGGVAGKLLPMPMPNKIREGLAFNRPPSDDDHKSRKQTQRQ